MRRTDVLIIGGGQAGLAMSHVLGERRIDHVILERGRVAERWRSERWDSLRLLTPRWQSRLPGWSWRGSDPDGFMSRDEVVRYLAGYAQSFDAPVRTGVAVTAVTKEGDGYRVETSRGVWLAASVVIATGHCDVPFVPPFASELAPGIAQVVPTQYRNPAQLPAGGVLVVGSSATGIQLAAEIRRSGRPVTLAVGHHTRMPRRYRGRDIMEWLDTLGVLAQRADQVRDLEASRRSPSFQLVGSEGHATLDLGMLMDLGVRLVGHAVGARGARIELAGDLVGSIAAAEAKLARLTRQIDESIAAAGLTAPPAESRRAIEPPQAPPVLDLEAEGIRSVLWATGYRRDYSWLRVPVLDDRGEIRHDGGVTPSPGLYVLGLRFLRRRNSNFIDGVGADAVELADHLIPRLARRVAAVA